VLTIFRTCLAGNSRGPCGRPRVTVLASSDIRGSITKVKAKSFIHTYLLGFNTIFLFSVRTLSSGPSSISKDAFLSLRSGFKTTWQWWQASLLGLHYYRWGTMWTLYFSISSLLTLYLPIEKSVFFYLLDFWHLFSAESCERHWRRARELVRDSFVFIQAQFHSQNSDLFIIHYPLLNDTEI